MRNDETVNLDKWLVKRATKQGNKPKVLLVPTASKDLGEYIADFSNRYISYGAKVEVLLLANEVPPRFAVKEKILSADIIYFGGGDMDFAFSKFRKYNLVCMLEIAIKKGALVGGLSAGAAMFAKLFLDFEWNGLDFVNFRLNKGYGWVDYLIWTHFSKGFLKNKKAIAVLPKNKQILTIGDGTLVYWDKNLNMKAIKNNNKGSCVVGSFIGSKFNLEFAPQIENVNRNI